MKLLFHNLKYRLQIFLHKLGWHVSKYEPKKSESNAYLIQKDLLSNIDVATIFDVGAWIGNTTAEYKVHFPAAHVHSFEPFPESFRKFSQKHADPNSGVTPNQVAISDSIGSATFHSNKIETTNSLLPSSGTDSKNDFFRDTVNTIEVPTMTLDEYCKANSIQRINILKMDTQGGELKALHGASKLISEKKIDLIYCEVSFMEMYEGSPLFQDIAAHLKENGYQLHNLYDLNLNERGELAWGDAIFLPTHS